MTLPGSFRSVVCVCVGTRRGGHSSLRREQKVRNGNRKHRPLFLGHLTKEEQENRMVIIGVEVHQRRTIVKEGTVRSCLENDDQSEREHDNQ